MMNTKELETIKKAAGNLEGCLKAIEDFLESSNSRPLYQATGCMVEALRHLHEADPGLLNPENLERVEALLAKEKIKSGRDSFNTGF